MIALRLGGSSILSVVTKSYGTSSQASHTQRRGKRLPDGMEQSRRLKEYGSAQRLSSSVEAAKKDIATAAFCTFSSRRSSFSPGTHAVAAATVPRRAAPRRAVPSSPKLRFSSPCRCLPPRLLLQQHFNCKRDVNNNNDDDNDQHHQQVEQRRRRRRQRQQQQASKATLCRRVTLFPPAPLTDVHQHLMDVC